MGSSAVSTALLLLALGTATSRADAPECKTFRQIYGSGKNLCEKMWGSAFKYVKRNATNPAYTMSFYGENPNTEVTRQIHNLGTHDLFGYDSHNGHDFCLDYYHKDSPSPTPGMTECNAWAGHSCCNADTVSSPQKLKEAYGKEYHWDRCGRLSSGCERFFVLEACFYECEPAASLFAMYPNHPDASQHAKFRSTTNDSNGWEIEGMPIDADFCDAWYDACQNDMFCASSDGNYFDCAREYAEEDAKTLRAELNEAEDDNKKMIVAVVVIAVVTFIAICALLYLIMRERAGKPVYAPVPKSTVPGEPTEMPQA